MSEKITIDCHMPRGYKKLRGLEITPDGEDIAVSGIITLGERNNSFQSPVALRDDPREMWGYPKEDRLVPEPESKVHQAAAKLVGAVATAATAIKDKVSPASVNTPTEAIAPAAQDTEEQARTETAAEPEFSDEIKRYIDQEVARQVEQRTKELQDQNNQLGAENKRLAERIKQLENELKKAKEGSTEPAPPAEDATPAESGESEPAVAEADATVEDVLIDQPRQGWLGRLRDRTTIATGNLMTGRSTEVRETDRRRRIIGGVALFAAGILAWELVVEPIFFGHSSSRELRHHFQDQIAQLKIQEANDHTAEMNAIAANQKAAMDAIAAANSQEMAAIAQLHNDHTSLANGLAHHHYGHGAGSHHSVTAAGKTTEASLRYRGDTVWHEVSERLRSRFGHSANNEQIAKATDRVLKLNGLKWNGGGPGVDAHKLPVGFHFKIPTNIAQMFKK